MVEDALTLVEGSFSIRGSCDSRVKVGPTTFAGTGLTATSPATNFLNASGSDVEWISQAGPDDNPRFDLRFSGITSSTTVRSAHHGSYHCCETI